MGDFDRIEEINGRRRFIWPDYTKLRFSKKQADYQYAEEPLEIGMAGRGFGKDFGGLWKKARRGNRGYWRNRLNPNFRRVGLRWHTGIFAGEKDSYEDNINKLFSILPKVPGKGVGGKPNFHWNSTDERFELYGERQWWISMYSLHGKGQKRGPGFDDVLVTEAQEISKEKIMSVVMPMIVRGGYNPNITLIGTGNCGWFDKAYLEAQAGDPDTYWGNWAAFDGTSFDNPEMDEETAQQALREYSENPSRFWIERLGLPNIILRPDEKPDCPFYPGMVDCALTHDRLTLDGPPLLVIDLIYGGEDELCVGVWNKHRAHLLWPEFYTSQDLQIDIGNPWSSLVRFFEKLSQRFPGATFAYDCQGNRGGSLQAYLPKHIKIIPMRRGNEEKNAMVEGLIERMGILDAQGHSLGIKMPHPDSRWLDTDKKRKDMRKLLEQIYNYRRIVSVSPSGRTMVRYTKGVGYGDDGMDMLSWGCSQLPPMNRKPVDARQAGRALKRGLYL